MSKIECRHTDIVVKKDGTSVCSDCGGVGVVPPSVTRAREFVKETKTMIDAIELERRRKIRDERERLVSQAVGLPAQPSAGAPTAGGADPNVRTVRAFMCKSDFEIGAAAGVISLYATEKDCREGRRIGERGLVEVEVRLVRIIQAENIG